MAHYERGELVVPNTNGFQAFLRRYRQLLAWAVGTGLVPFILSFTSIEPPWPSKVAPITAIVQLIALIGVYKALRKATARIINRVLLASASGLFLSALIYGALFLNFTYKLDENGPREAKGFVCTTIAKRVYPDKCPFLGPEELKLAENIPTNLWPETSINLVYQTLLVLWLIAFMMLSVFVGSFLIAQPRRGNQKRSPRRERRHAS